MLRQFWGNVVLGWAQSTGPDALLVRADQPREHRPDLVGVASRSQRLHFAQERISAVRRDDIPWLRRTDVEQLLPLPDPAVA